MFKILSLPKKLLSTISIFSFIIFISSCEKSQKDRFENENHCPIVADSLVPQVVKDSFAFRFPTLSARAWFYKDSSSYCALSGVEPQEQLAQFATNGSFIKIVTEVENEEAGEPASDTSGGIESTHFTCECEIDNGHHD